ncbi:hypothetical protein TNCT_369981 [Trichonephila clavata]|uniref:Uncharacterized protein n=1 Tax=Trichonephila clavata TaxID=2740835 RepID=A0A8X6HXA1_TRICU|nr:hypothetical protein TNCT_369981 [Trichonephila clavata]
MVVLSKGEGYFGYFYMQSPQKCFRRNSRRWYLALKTKHRMFKEPDVIHYIKIRYLVWTGHVICLNDRNILQETLSVRPCYTRARRPVQDCLVFKTKNWRCLAASRGN